MSWHLSQCSGEHAASANEHPEVIRQYPAAEYCQKAESLAHWFLYVNLGLHREGVSVNDGIGKPLGSLTHVQVTDAVEGVLSFGKECW